MFIGHYGLALAAKRLAPGKSLGWNFIAAQLLDLLWAPAVLLGIEHVRIVPGFMPASPFDFYDYPWTHGLAMAAVWSWFFLSRDEIAAAGHAGVLPLGAGLLCARPRSAALSGRSRVGLGLWKPGLAIQLNCTRAKNGLGRGGMMAFTLSLIAIEIGNVYGPPPPNVKAMAISGEIAYLVFVGIAAWLDRMRESVA